MNDPKRAEIKARIAAAQARERAKAEQSTTRKVADKASEATDAFTGFVKEHPLASAAGGLALGILIAGMFKGPRRAAATGGAKAAGIAAIGAEIASSFASELFDDAKGVGRAGARRAEDFSDAMGDRARSIRRDASYNAGRAGDAARIAGRETGKKLARAFRRH